VSKVKRPALGRGLGALIPTVTRYEPIRESDETRPGLRTVAIEALEPNPDQPRKHFDVARLGELADSIRTHGIIQPIVVSSLRARPGVYVIVAGERRWRAAQLAGLHDVPIVVRDTPQYDQLELAVVENLQRADLNPIEEARAFKQLVDLRGYTQEQLAERIGKDRTTVTNALRLLRLPDSVQDMVESGELGMGHARALLGLADDSTILELARETVRKRWSARAVERAVRAHAREPAVDEVPNIERERRAIIVAELQDRLRRALGVRVTLKPARRQAGKHADPASQSGVIEIPWTTLDELDRVLQVLLDERAG